MVTSQFNLYTQQANNQIISYDYQNPALKAAGTLPYAINPRNQEVYVLLSKERIWEGPSSGKWKGFGGKKELNETLVQTAVRETFEESRTIVKIEIDQIPYDSLIVVVHNRCKYLQLMLPIEYDPSMIQRFKNSSMDDPHYMEKTEIRWVRLKDLLSGIQDKSDPAIYLDGEKLSLAADFTETMTILHQKATMALKELMEDKTCSAAILVSDPKTPSRL